MSKPKPNGDITVTTCSFQQRSATIGGLFQETLLWAIWEVEDYMLLRLGDLLGVVTLQ